MMTVRVIQAEDTRALRHQVLWPHIENVENCVIDIDNRVDAIHLGTFDGERLVSVGSLFEMRSDKLEHRFQYRLRAMATDPDFRGRSAGKILINKAVEILEGLNCEVLWCDARLHATGFYSSLGFKKLEEIYQVKNIGPHQFMWKELQQVKST